MESPPSTERTGAAAGDVIGHDLVVERVIGEGNTTMVVAALHKARGTRVAVRIARAADHESAVRFKRAARAMAALESPYTVRVHEVGETKDGLPCAIMEHLEGRTLASLLEERGPIGIDDAIHWMLQTCEAVAEAHDAGLLHRNLEPRSLFLVDSGDAPGVRVLDFGLGATERVLDPSEMELRPGEAPGTSRLMAPEQLRGEVLDVRVDVWGAGACLFRMLTKRDPFPGETLAELCSAVVAGPRPKLGRYRPEVSGGLEALVTRCLLRTPGDRFRDMRELAQALREARDEARNTPIVPVGEAMLEELRVTPAVMRAAEPRLDVSPGAPTPKTLRIVPPIGPPTAEDGPETIPLDRRPTNAGNAPSSAERRETVIRAALGEALAPLLAEAESPRTESAPAPRGQAEVQPAVVSEIASDPPPARGPSLSRLEDFPPLVDAAVPGLRARARRRSRRSKLGPVLFGIGFAGTITVALIHARREAPVGEPTATAEPPSSQDAPLHASAEPQAADPSAGAAVTEPGVDASAPSPVPTPRATTRRPSRPQPSSAPSSAEPSAEEDPILKKRK